MTTGRSGKLKLPRMAGFSFGFIAFILILVGCLHLGTAFVTTCFAFFALQKLYFLKHRGKWLPILLFIVLLTASIYGLGSLINQLVRALPEISDQAIPSIIELAKQHHIELPFSDYDSLKEIAMETVKNQSQYLGSFVRLARGATSQLAYLIIGAILALGIFVDPHLNRVGDSREENLYSLAVDAIRQRFRTFYESFATVMGAQIIISAINTALTAIFVLVVHLPHGLVVVGATFLFGLVPVVGNLISNTIIVCIGVTVSPTMAIATLVFLVAVHKLEYLLNSKIVGDRIRNPFWMTLLALLLGERLMGIPGMILAPVILKYIKLEASQIYPARAPTNTPLQEETQELSCAGRQD
jgi:predicted PurR-regulated permease PerM